MSGRFTEEELHSLTFKRFWLFITFLLIIPICLFLIAFICSEVLHIGEDAVALIPILGLFTSIFVFIYCLSKYKDSVRKTAYFLISQHCRWSLLRSKKEDFFTGVITRLGLLRENEFIEQHNFLLQGEQEGHSFMLQNILLMAIRGSGAAHGPVTKAEYTLLTTAWQTTPISCNILIKKNKLFKWDIKNLQRIKLQDKAFEKLYDIYTDDPHHALALLQGEFIQLLLRHIHTTKKQLELIITPHNIFVLYNTGIWKKLFSPIIFRHPRVQCEKIFKEINDMLDILPVISLLENPRA